MQVIDCFPFFNELDVLEIRLNELKDVVDRWVIVESTETFGGDSKPLHLKEALCQGRFSQFVDRIELICLTQLRPICQGRVTGRAREAYQRDQLWPSLNRIARPSDLVLFSDCDEIPSATAIRRALDQSPRKVIHRLSQRSYYYTVNWLVDIGHDFASRARCGPWEMVKACCGSMYSFRMYQKDSPLVIEEGGWHFSYFGGPEQIKTKVAALAPFLEEYKLFGDTQLRYDIYQGYDLHHRKCELPLRFRHCASDDPVLPQYYLDNQEQFKHFTVSHALER